MEGGHQANGHLESNGRASAWAHPLKHGDLAAWMTQVCWWVFRDLTCANSTRSLLGLPSPNPDKVGLPEGRAAKTRPLQTHPPTRIPGAGRLPRPALQSQSRKCPQERGGGVSLSKQEVLTVLAPWPAWCEGSVRKGASLDLWVISPGTKPWEEPLEEYRCAGCPARSFHTASSEALSPPQRKGV